MAAGSNIKYASNRLTSFLSLENLDISIVLSFLKRSIFLISVLIIDADICVLVLKSTDKAVILAPTKMLLNSLNADL